VITANAMPFLKLFDRAPLIQPTLFKTAIYWIATFIARLTERFVRFSVIEGNRPGDFAAYLISDSRGSASAPSPSGYSCCS
jgi:hypothetical protein